MADDVVIRMEHGWKRYGTTLTDEFKRLLSRSTSISDKNGRWVLRDLNFEIRRGDTLGVIGRNGAGKSTLLKILAGVSPITKGIFEIRGRIFPMIELNAGMHMDLTGRQNVHLLGAVVGFTPQDMEDRMLKIKDFCELDDYFDRPVWTYSSGMLARLGFGVAVNIDADILLVDEILSVGDLPFQRKCYKEIEKLRKGGVTTIFVSHSIRQIERLSSEVILLDHGQIIKRGEPTEVCHFYMKEVTEDSLKKAGLLLEEELSEATWEGSGEVIITNIEIFNKTGQLSKTFLVHESMKLRIEFEANNTIKNPIVGVGIYTADMLLLAAFSNEQVSFGTAIQGKNFFECEIPDLIMLAGVYSIGITIKGRDNSMIYKGLHLASFNVQYSAQAKQSRGLIHVEARWNFN